MKNILVLILFCLFYKGFSQKTDTLHVYQADTSVFEKMDFISHRPCSRPEIVTRYKLIEPKDNVYYYIYNDKNLLVKAGKYTENYIIDEVEQTAGFYNLKKFYYKKNKKLSGINYQEDGRNIKTEFYDGKNKLKRIRYFDKKSEKIVKLELYKNNELKETRIFKNYYAKIYDTIIKHE